MMVHAFESPGESFLHILSTWYLLRDVNAIDSVTGSRTGYSRSASEKYGKGD